MVSVVRHALYAAVGLLCAAPALAANTDVVVLQNGDRFTGEVRQLSRGQLRLKTDDLGTVYVEWDKIASVATLGRYEVITRAGGHILGALAAGAAGVLQIVAEDGSVTSAPMLDVVAIDRIRTGFFDRIDGTLDLGATYTKSSGVAQTSLNLDAAYRRPRLEAFTIVSANLTRQKEVPYTSRFAVKAGYTRFRTERWFITPFVFAERNPDLGLTLRGLGALVAGRYLHRSNRATVALAGGAAAGRERPIEGGTIANLDALVSFATSLYAYDYPKTNIDFSVLLFPELNRWGRVRANVDAKLKRELFKDFFAGIIVYDVFDSEPQVAAVARNDIGVTLSIGWTF